MDHPFAPLPAIEPESEAWWTACREGRLEMTRCRTCRWFVHPARPICSRCRSRDVAPETLSGLATVVTYTVNHQRWMPGIEVPYVIAIVELVEQRNLRLTTNIVGCPPEAVHIGMPVKVTFRKASDEISLPLFEPDPAPRPDASALRTTPDTPPKAHRHRRGPGAAAPARRAGRAPRAPRDPVRRRAVGDRPAALSHRHGPDRRGRAARHRRCRSDARRHRRHRVVSRSHGCRAGRVCRPRHRRGAGRPRALGRAGISQVRRCQDRSGR